MIKFDSVQQYKVYEFIKLNFVIDDISIEKVDKYSLKVIDKKGDSIILKYSWGKVITKNV
ncbi:MAG: hypothetical protein Q8900_14070 [Bacillota bacterium]|nr:hypothetical protein [Bacillota bacterium]